MKLQDLRAHQYARISDACVELIRAAVDYDVSATEIRNLMAELWKDELSDRATLAVNQLRTP